jgi:hypothetical protein
LLSNERFAYRFLHSGKYIKFDCGRMLKNIESIGFAS